ncbi:MAG: hypothetical protein ACP5J4_14500 [Anaerolineae bacterium]
MHATSSFVDPEGEAMLWHDFGPLEGPGWAANAVGGAHLLYRWGIYLGDAGIQKKALRLVDHVLKGGFVQPDGLIPALLAYRRPALLPQLHSQRRLALSRIAGEDRRADARTGARSACT